MECVACRFIRSVVCIAFNYYDCTSVNLYFHLYVANRSIIIIVLTISPVCHVCYVLGVSLMLLFEINDSMNIGKSSQLEKYGFG